jgi:hypothetical protein
MTKFPDDTSSLRLLTTDDGCVLLDIQHDRLLRLNRIAAEMWTLLGSGHSERDTVARLSQKYDISEDRVARDVSELIRRISELDATGTTVCTPPDDDDSSHPTSYPSFPWYGAALRDGVPPPQRLTIAAALIGLALFDLVLSLFSLRAMCWCVRLSRLMRSKAFSSALIGRVCIAVHRACVWYPKRTLCLQRSAVTTCLLRLYGVPAVMKIGVRPMPFLAHAWVEVEGSVVNDWPRVKHFYRPLFSN